MLIGIVVLLLVIGAIALAIVTLRSFKHNAYRSRLAHKVAEYSPPSSPWKGSRWFVVMSPTFVYFLTSRVQVSILQPILRVW
jgi:3-deoxy-D-manno-octulosonic-acid transferase